MSGIQGIGGVGGPAPEQRPSDVRNRDRESATVEPRQGQDGVEISGEASRAQDAARLQEVARQQDDIRVDRVEEARQALERGEFQEPTVLREVAQRLLRILE